MVDEQIHRLRTVRYLADDGVGLVGDQSGKGGAPAVVLMHGGGQTRHSWAGAGAALSAAGYEVINYDARGHGESDWSDEGAYSLRRRAADLSTVLEGVDGNYALVGASLGGATAMQAVADGLRPAALVLVDIVPRPDPRAVARIRNFMLGHPHGFASPEEAMAAVIAYNPHRAQHPGDAGLKKNLRLREDGRFYWHWDPRILAGDAQDDIVEFEQTVEGMLRAQGLPILLIRGMKSDVVTDQGVSDFVAALPDLEIFEVAGAGHMVAGDDNDLFNQGVLGFLQRHLPADLTVPY
jgi:pimeloyl-ACP methyl ester carboxylesterase